MPEGDVVWLTAKRLDAALAGRELTRTDFRVPALATVDLTGRVVLSVASRGKHLLTRIDGGLTLHTHLRMDGSWHLYATGRRWRGGPGWQVRIVLANRDYQAVGYRLPVVELLPTADEAKVVGHLGPDLLGGNWDLNEAVRRVRSSPSVEIGQALLDQRNVAGIGNLFKAEALFLSGVSPWTAVSEVVNVEEVLERARSLLERNKNGPDQVTTGDRRPGRQHWVFERSGRPCYRCGTPVRSAEQGGLPRARLTYWCPTCQPGPTLDGHPRRTVEDR